MNADFLTALTPARYNQLGEDFVRPVNILPLKEFNCAFVASEFAASLNIDAKSFQSSQALKSLNGLQPMPFQPTASVYSGHQFGHYNPRLGDGRAMLIGEACAYEWQLKGAGPTPYSRQGDGRAVLRSSIRELLAAEALHALNVPTTRALALFNSRERVYREQVEPGAVVLRGAKSFIRFGHFEYFFHTRQEQALDELFEFALATVYPEFLTSEQPRLMMFQEIVRRTAKLVANWQAVGFAHGVLNTDNMAISGETLDFGPYGFLDDFNPQFICNHSDHQGRYAFDQQPGIGLWNLNMLAHAFTPWVPVEQLRAALMEYQGVFSREFLQLMRSKLGLVAEQAGDGELISEWLAIIAEHQSDYTLAHRWLIDCTSLNSAAPLIDNVVNRERAQAWYQQWQTRTAAASEQTLHLLKTSNPQFILRNYLAQEVIEAAEDRNDWQPLANLYQVLSQPFDAHPEHAKLAATPPDWGKKLEISCSS